ncbi:Ig-like domain-containing protein [Tepidibacter thalassicus]|uniref:SbsA Ig-like domain-containing protein n=1 Tax=Tepidibacter thalassicus DSM 15285 TaxID=1123350 RepID=A0A1M5RAM8_9FIRM|nr:Ig-like domain-containing protein [Tepidibacter thalassicus]SHH23311.1 hypothetical protein SAMN02744040_01307 [Tepidibacter thalassicus DSM 15285]
MIRKITAFIIVFCMILMSIPVQYVWANTSKVDISFKAVDSNGKDITKGQKNVDFDISYINILFDPTFKISSESKLKDIKVYAGGDDETYKFDIGAVNGALTLNLKNAPSNGGSMHPYQFRKHTLYNIYIPEGVFINESASQINKAENFTFVTNTDSGMYKKDILKSITPGDNESSVDCNKGIITFEFIDDIELNSDVIGHLEDYIKISTTPIDINIPSYKEDSIDNYNVKIEGNKLILQSKDGKLSDFAEYTVKLKDKTVYLKGSSYIYNKAEKNIDGEFEVVKFKTDNMIESTNPSNNAENVSVEPTIEFKFKYPVDVDFNKISFVEDNASDLAVEIPTDIHLSSDKKTLYIKVNDNDSKEKYLLRRHTIYKVVIGKGGVTFKDYPSVENDEILFYFITTDKGEAPEPTNYSSSTSFIDDIRDMDKTNLSDDGCIYIKFNRDIQWDKENENLSSIGATHLYKIPVADKREYSSKGELYDKEYFYQRDNDGIFLRHHKEDGTLLEKENERIKEEVPVESVEIVNGNTIKIKPKYKLLNRNEYEVIIDKELIEDKNGYNIRENLNFRFWTKPSSESTSPSWDVYSIDASEIKEYENVPHKSYKIYGTPKYSPDTPIIINVKGEVIPSAKDFEIKGELLKNKALEKVILNPTYSNEVNATINNEEENIDVGLGQKVKLLLKDDGVELYSENPEIVSVDKNSIKGITKGTTKIYAVKDGETVATINVTVKDTELNIEKIKIEYYYENGVKNTKLYLYLNNTLDSGKSYNLYIPQGVFEARSKNKLPSLDIKFVVSGDTNQPIGIEKINKTSFSIDDLLANDEWFEIYGYNFNEKIEGIELERVDNPDSKIMIDKKDIYFMGVDEIKVAIRGDVKEKIINAKSQKYKLILKFKDKNPVNSPVDIEITSMSKPTPISKYPDETGIYDERGLKHVVQDDFTKDRYFLKLTFKDLDGELDVNEDLVFDKLLNSSVKSDPGAASMIDKEFINIIKSKGDYDRKVYIRKYIFVKNEEKKEAYLYIPIKLLDFSLSYTVTLKAGIVKNSVGESDAITWQFKTQLIPYVGDIIVGSVPEDYDDNTKIILKGNFFNEDTEVYFNDVKADDHYVKEIKDSDGNVVEKYLYVYLPDGRDRLDPGLYNIRILNDDNHEIIKYGVLSVVKEGDYVPEEDHRIKDDNKKGEVWENIKVSEDIIVLNSKYKKKSYVELDLDKLMGEDTLVRKIKYEGSKSGIYSTLYTKSKYADINIYNLTPDDYDEDKDIVVNVGRVEPLVVKTIKRKLGGANVVSDFIQVTGDNFNVGRIELKIPFLNSSGDNINVLRYDEELRNWYEVPFTVDKVDKYVNVNSKNKGIFVVVD